MKELIIKVNGMMCEGCENRIKNALKNINDIEDVQANYKEGIVIITSNKEINKKIIEEKIDDLGFEIVKED